MAQATDPPHQVSFEQVCTIVGRLYIESQSELERLRAILLQQNQKLQQQDKELLTTKELLANLTNGTST